MFVETVSSLLHKLSVDVSFLHPSHAWCMHVLVAAPSHFCNHVSLCISLAFACVLLCFGWFCILAQCCQMMAVSLVGQRAAQLAPFLETVLLANALEKIGDCLAGKRFSGKKGRS